MTGGELVEVLVLLDSTVLIDHLRGRPVASRVNRLREAGDIACTTAINVEEIVRGLRPAEHEGASRLFDGLRLLPLSPQVAWTAGTWRREHAERGVTLWQADCLVAAAAFVAGAKLATGNPNDFPMSEVDVEHWPVGT